MLQKEYEEQEDTFAYGKLSNTYTDEKGVEQDWRINELLDSDMLHKKFREAPRFKKEDVIIDYLNDEVFKNQTDALGRQKVRAIE